MNSTFRARLIQAINQAVSDPTRRTTRERVWAVADRITPVDQELVRAIHSLLVGTTDDPLSSNKGA